MKNFSTSEARQGGFLVPAWFLYGEPVRRAWPVRLWRWLRRKPIDDWRPGLYEKLAAVREEVVGMTTEEQDAFLDSLGREPT